MSVAMSTPDADRSSGTSMSNVTLDVTHTLCDLRGEPSGVVSIGSVSGREAVWAVHTKNITSQLDVQERSLYETGSDDPVGQLLTPVVVQSLCSIEAAGPNPGWDAYVFGAGLEAAIHSMVCRWAGARSVLGPSDIDRNHAVGGENSPAEKIYFLFGVTNRAIVSLLAAAADRSKVVVNGLDSDGPQSVDFYGTIHRKDLELIVPAHRLSQESIRRANTLISRRLSLDTLALETVDELPGEQRASVSGDYVVLRWPSQL